MELNVCAFSASSDTNPSHSTTRPPAAANRTISAKALRGCLRWWKAKRQVAALCPFDVCQAPDFPQRASLFEHRGRRIQTDNMCSVFSKRTHNRAGTAGKINGAIIGAKIRRLDDQIKHVIDVQFRACGKPSRLARELVNDCAVMRVILSSVHGRGSKGKDDKALQPFRGRPVR
jgi:hypothetical protein